MTTYEQMLNGPYRKGLKQEEFIIQFIEAVLEVMGEKNISMINLAERLGRKPSEISTIFDGSKELTARIMSDIADAVGCSIHLSLKDDVV